MRGSKASAEDVAVLVFELARAIRARAAGPEETPASTQARQRCLATWRAFASAHGDLALELRDGALAQEGGGNVAGSGATELAALFQVRHARVLRARGEPAEAELASLIELLARAPEELVRAGGIAQALRASGARALELFGREDKKAAAGGEDAYFAAQIAELVRLLAELERCDEVSSYNLIANKVEICADVLLRAKRGMEAYRAALVYTRHATDQDARPVQIRREANDRLRRLAQNEALLAAVIEQACSGSGLASVKANQVLICLGASAVPALLKQLEKSKEPVRARVTQALIAVGDSAVALAAEDLVGTNPERARRGARLLGEMQNPRGVSFLADALAGRDPALAREAAQALAKIGGDAAVQALIAGLDGAPEIAETCAGCLGGLRHPAASRVLGELVDPNGRRPENLCRAAIRSLGRLGGSEALVRLKRVLDHNPTFGRSRVRPLRVAAAQAIAQIGGPAAFQALYAHARGGDAAVRQACLEALRRLERAVANEKA
jgi:HEAT repeat protein